MPRGSALADTIRYPMRHVLDFFGEARRAKTVTEEDLQSYVVAAPRHRACGAGSIKVELAMLEARLPAGPSGRSSRVHAQRRPDVPDDLADQLGVRRNFLRSEQAFRLLSYPGDRRRRSGALPVRDGLAGERGAGASLGPRGRR